MNVARRETRAIAIYDTYAARALAGETLGRDDARAVLSAPDDDLRALLLAAFRVREQHFGRRVKVCL